MVLHACLILQKQRTEKLKTLRKIKKNGKHQELIKCLPTVQSGRCGDVIAEIILNLVIVMLRVPKLYPKPMD